MEHNTPGVALRDCRGPLNSLMEALSGPNGPMQLEAFNRFLRKDNPWPQEVVIEARGGPKTVQGWLCVLEGMSRIFQDIAKRVLDQAVHAGQESPPLKPFTICSRSVAELGFDQGANLDQILSKAHEEGLDTLYANQIPWVLLQNLRRGLGVFILATEAFTLENVLHDKVLTMEQNEYGEGKVFVTTESASENYAFPPHCVFLFLRTRK